VLSAHSPDDTENRAMAVTNTVRVPHRSASHPLSGISTARVIRYVVIATPTSAGRTPSERAMSGAAVDRIVPSRISMK
jgi:hypothetical protein